MQRVLQAIADLGYTTMEGGNVSIDSGAFGSSLTNYMVLNPSFLTVDVESGANISVVVVHNDQSKRELKVDYNVNEGASLEVIEIFTSESSAQVNTTLHESSQCKIVSLQLGSSNVNFNLELGGVQARGEIDTLQLTTASEKCILNVDMRHMSADCSSRSLSKCVASGESTIEFDGLVYVAEGAQRTDAQQNNRNIALSDDARIIAQPQLEIYADDVKCSHGSTVGQIDTDAILYMRQRGLSEAQARRVQVEGFVADIVDRYSNESLVEVVKEIVTDKLETM